MYIYKFINILFDNDSNILFLYENDNFLKVKIWCDMFLLLIYRCVVIECGCNVCVFVM